MTSQAAAAARAALREAATELIGALSRGPLDPEAVARRARELREQREFDLLELLAERARTFGDDRPETSLYLAQALVDTDRPRLAADVLATIAASLCSGDPRRIDALGLAGRCWKEVVLALPDDRRSVRQGALVEAMRSYRAAFLESGRRNSWTGVNLLALAVYADRNGLEPDEALQVRSFTDELCDSLNAVPEENRDGWHHATAAELAIARRDLGEAERHIRLYLASPQTTAFALEGTLRQFTRLWCLREEGMRGRSIVAAMEAATLRRRGGGHIEMSAAALHGRDEAAIDPATLQAILGRTGVLTYEWLRTGLARARSVCAVVHETGRKGSGFVVLGRDLDPRLGDEKFVLTNRHVISDDPADEGFPPGECHLVFEAVDAGGQVKIECVQWFSPVTELDAALLRVRWKDLDLQPLPIAPNLPAADGQQRVYVIGHPAGAEISFSLQDNALLEHEGPTAGTPPNPGVCRLHYRAPTDHGSSGSPVFNRSRWRVIALHHAGGELPRLNGKSGKWPANEGIWIQSIVEAIRAS